MSNGKVMITHLIAGLIKKKSHKMSQYFPKPCKPFEGDINFKLDLSTYTTKADLNGTWIDTTNCILLSFHVPVSEWIHTL